MVMGGLTGQCEFLLPKPNEGERRFKRKYVKDQAKGTMRERDVHRIIEIDARCDVNVLYVCNEYV